MISVCLWLVGMSVQAAGSLPEGRWEVAEVTIEKDTDGDIKIAVYKTAAEVESYIPCLKGLEIKDLKMLVLHYPNGFEETCEYTLESNQLSIFAAAAVQSYNYNIRGEELILTTVYNYVNNRPAGYTENIGEKWTIILKIKQK